MHTLRRMVASQKKNVHHFSLLREIIFVQDNFFLGKNFPPHTRTDSG